jgi:hypothetical protein
MTASSVTIAASLPPSSRVTRVSVLEAISIIRLPPLTLPVKHTLATSASWIRPAMASSRPVTTFSTPGGSFSATRCTTRVVASGAEGGGLTMAVLPASRACGRAAPRIAIGQLNGTMTVTTPSGW